MSDFVNLTRSPLTITNGNEHTVLPPSGQFCNVRKIVTSVYNVDGLPASDVTYEVDGMPDTTDGGLYVVSWKALMVMKTHGYDTSDIYAPDLFVRDRSNNVVAARILSRIV